MTRTLIREGASLGAMFSDLISLGRSKKRLGALGPFDLLGHPAVRDINDLVCRDLFDLVKWGSWSRLGRRQCSETTGIGDQGTIGSTRRAAIVPPDRQL